MLPESVMPDLKKHLEKTKALHQVFTARGFGEVELPYALERKYPNAKYEWGWQYVFRAKDVSTDPRSGARRRHHIHESTLQRAVKKAIMLAGITKHAGCHTEYVKIHSATALPRICRNPVRIFALYKNC